MRTTLCLVLLTLAPTAAAAWPWEAPSVTLEPSRIGERASWEIVESDGDQTRVVTVVTLLESAGRIPDRFAIPRDVEAIRIDRYEDGEWTAAERCHGLRGGPDAVRRELLHDGRPSQVSPVFDNGMLALAGTFQHEARDLATFTPDRCDHRNLLGGLTLREGDRARLGALLRAEFKDDPEDTFGGVVSDPARASRWHGRAALVFTFDMRDALREWASDLPGPAEIEGLVAVTFADGLPGYVEAEVRYTDWSGPPKLVTESRRLTAFEPAAAGAPRVGDWTNARLPEKWPAERMRPLDRLMLDDQAFGFPFRYHEAWESQLADPTTGLASFLARHPDAHLRSARAERGARDPDLPTLPSDGSWLIVVCGENECHGTRSFRVALSQTLPVKAIRHHTEGDLPEPAFVPADLAVPGIDSATADLMLRGVGYEFGTWGNLIYGAGYGPGWSGDQASAGLIMSDTSLKDPTLGDQIGKGIWLSLTGDGVGAVFEERIRQGAGPTDGILPVTRPTARFSEAGGAAPLWMPSNAALAVGAVAGVGLLALVAKALWGLYSRLAPSDVLAHPVRAALLDRIRREPGIHRAALVRAFGVGNGATRYHLARLVRHGHVHATEEGGYVRYFPTGALSPEEAAREALLRAGRNREVYALYAADPEVTLREAARRLGVAAPTVFRAKRRLEKAGILPAPPAELVEA